MEQTIKKSYKHNAPFDSGFLSVGSIHRIHYEQYGLQAGRPGKSSNTSHQPKASLTSSVVFLHGGPGGSTSIKNTIFFNPLIYRVILFDQRGCGQSLPYGSILENDTSHLVSDIEALRKHLEIQRWHVFGASWGSTLTLLYAQDYSDAVVSLVVRGVAPRLEKEEIDFNESFKRTASFHPEMYAQLVGHLSEEERRDVAGSYEKRFSCGDRGAELAAMRMIGKWGGVVSRLVSERKEDANDAMMTEAEEESMIASTRIQTHYQAHNLWLREMHYLDPEQLEKIKDIPCTIVNGRYDLICPPSAAWSLHKALPKSKLFIIPDAGHSAAVRPA